MNPWGVYNSRMNATGATRRTSELQRATRSMGSGMKSSLAFQNMIINGEPRGVSVIDSDNLNQKTICSLPGEDIPPGGTVEWMGEHWLVTQRDANNEVYTKGVMQQCNYLLKWVSPEHHIIERWCIVEDGTKYLTGELNDSRFIMSRGDSRISITLPRDSETIRLNRESRFLVDDYGSPTVLAYRLTKPFKLSDANFGRGVFTFVLSECAVEETDNLELHIPNYYAHFPREDSGDMVGCGSQFNGDYSEPSDYDAIEETFPENFIGPDPKIAPPGKKVWF